MAPDAYVIVAIALVAVVTLLIGSLGVRISRSTSDFLVASRSVGSRWNAAAITGEYLSAASFLGIAGLVFRDGVDALWYSVSATTGYLAVLLFVAAPLRRSGAYTVPDFAEARLGSATLRRIATALVIVIGWLYLVPLLKGGGLTLSTVTGLATWVGAVAVAVVVVLNVVAGGMRSITVVQAFQYWLKLAAIGVPCFVLLIVQFGEDPSVRGQLDAAAPPVFLSDTSVEVRTDVVLQVDEPTVLTATGAVDGYRADGPVYWGVGGHAVAADTELRFEAGSPVPVVDGSPARNDGWLAPLPDDRDYPLFQVYSVVIAGFLGVMGLPHVLARFYTNPNGRAARQTTFVVLGLLSVFYLFPMISGVLARLYVPQLLVTGSTDAAVLLLPGAALLGWPAQALTALVAAGAFAAFLATASGLVVSVAGVVSTDVLPGRVRDFRIAAVLAGAVPLGLALAATSLDITEVVALAFAVAASSFCPLLVLGIWWRGLTDIGAIVGLVVGGGLCAAAVLTRVLGVLPERSVTLLAQPAVITVPAAFVAMIVVSKLTRHRIPADVSRTLLRLHAPDRLGLSLDRDVARFSAAPLALPSPNPGRHRR